MKKMVVSKDIVENLSLIKLLTSIHFIGNEETCYSNDEFENENSVVNKMYNSDIVKRFNKFSYLSKYNRIYEFDKWNKFTYFYNKKKRRSITIISKNIN